MADTPHLIPLEYSNEERRNIVLTNIMKMLINRKLLNNDLSQIEPQIKKWGNPIDGVYKIELDATKDIATTAPPSYIIKILNQKISAINKTSGIIEHLTKYKKTPNLIVVLEINNKSLVYINKNFPNTEIFLEHDFMFNIVDNVLVPHHEVLSKEESEQVMLDYEAKKHHFPKIYVTDKIARYYNMQIGQICKILRPSETSGLVAFYRLVTKA